MSIKRQAILLMIGVMTLLIGAGVLAGWFIWGA